MERHIELFAAIEKALVSAGQMVIPCVYVVSDVDKAERDKLKETVRAHGGTVAGQWSVKDCSWGGGGGLSLCQCGRN